MKWLSRLVFFASLVNLSPFLERERWKDMEAADEYGKLGAEGQNLLMRRRRRRKRSWLLLQKQMLTKKLFCEFVILTAGVVR